ncbi:hypothetical protein EDC04DRAFT_2557869, partial [Pisolithus marmoratus]
WAYVRSHNFTTSAWGILSGSGFNPNVNYELGILFPLCNENEVGSIMFQASTEEVCSS